MTNTPLRPALFLHIQKTGGTSIQQMARRAYGADQVTSHDDYLRLGVEGCRAKAFVSGHFGFEFAKPLRAGRFFFTFLRDPVARVISFYHYCRIDMAPDFEPAAFARKHALGDFLRFCLDNPWYSSYVVNHQLDQLSYGYGHEMVMGRALSSAERQPTELLPLAMRNLEAFDYIGFIDRFDADVDLIFRCLGAGQKRIVRTNVSASGGRPDIDAPTLDLIREMTRHDSEIIEFARIVAAGKRQALEGPPGTGGRSWRGLRGFARRMPRPLSRDRRTGRVLIGAALGDTGPTVSAMLSQMLAQLGLADAIAHTAPQLSTMACNRDARRQDETRPTDAEKSRQTCSSADTAREAGPCACGNDAIVQFRYGSNSIDAVFEAGIEVRNIIIPIGSDHLHGDLRHRVEAGAPIGFSRPGRSSEGTAAAVGDGGQTDRGAALLALVEAAVRRDVPITFVAYPRFLADPDYLFDKISPIFPDLDRQALRALHDRIAPAGQAAATTQDAR
ncbi:MAG: hypothetical protein RIR62_1841 [Pseudomonadota bacterium]|jgi:hypothetical protein